MIVVLMGVSGSGKTTIGTLLAERMHAVFADADDYHSAANKAKMAAGHPLNDEDRQPWLETLNSLLLEWFEAGEGGVLACSALKDVYRKTLVRGLPPSAVRLCVARWIKGTDRRASGREEKSLYEPRVCSTASLRHWNHLPTRCALSMIVRRRKL